MSVRPPDLLLLLALVACARRPPAELQLPPEQVDLTPDTFTRLDDALAWMLRGDPLARHPRWPAQAAVLALPGGGPVAEARLALERAEIAAQDQALSLQAVEARMRGTVGVVFVRGYRLAVAERELARLNEDPAARELSVLAPLLTPLRPGDPREPATRHPLAFLASAGVRFGDAVRQDAELHTLTAWLESPDLPTGAVASALDGPSHDALAHSRVGQIVRARASGASGPWEAGLAHLDRATDLHLTRVAADRDAEQAAWRQTEAAAAAEIGAVDPVRELLLRAFDGLLAGAADPVAGGAAWLAASALRWTGSCDGPCAGVHRTADMRIAGTWHPEVEARASVWRVAGLKASLDRMEVARDTVGFGPALVDLTDALVGTGASPPSADLLRYRAADATVWRALAGMVGTAPAGTWEEVAPLLGAHLRAAADRAAETATPTQGALLGRISRRAVP